MSLKISRGDPRHPDATDLLKQSQALMQRLFPPEDNFFLDIDALCGRDIRFFVAKEDGRILGVGALALRKGYGEVKSMFTRESARGRGIAALLLAEIEAEARREGYDLLRLETGNSLASAHRIYGKAGFVQRGAFGDYPEAPSSLFMEKRLD
ncbi:GNAT family N-acetyltransferase [Oceanicola sp. 502str15]|uniref:GNAT family N-acetyltransferase n=1 Tax=Oceanicola sp. 502str15 TaxID=2696061 RepID=UPI002095B1C1|nr:GNAT family N-acetyltransferase [Oceanicola sp. 502str15]MCO6384774.1 GNAT family N-acetyltransferase [Oceanicola sp. 502str15]